MSAETDADTEPFFNCRKEQKLFFYFGYQFRI